MGKCNFCEFYNYIIGPERLIAADCYSKLQVALVDEIYNDAGDFCGRSTHYGYKLLYCPTCGKKLKANSKQVKPCKTNKSIGGT